MIDHDHIADLLPAYALDDLYDDEAVLVAEHLAACEKCHTRLTEFRQSTDLLAHAAPVLSAPDTVKYNLNMNPKRPVVRIGTLMIEIR